MTEQMHESQGSNMTNSDPVSSTSRRQVLQVGGLGALSAAFLAACGTDAYDTRPGVAGAGTPAPEVPPTVPPGEPNSAQLATQEVDLHTVASVEALLAETYEAHASVLSDDELRSAAERFAADHQAASETIVGHTESGEVDVANEDLKSRMVAPVERQLEPLLASGTEQDTVTANTAAIQMFHGLEMSLAATYVNSMSALTTPELRGEFAAMGAAAARRAAVLTEDPIATAPTTALFPVTDLIPGTSYLNPEAEEEPDGEDAEAEDAEG